MTEIVKALAEVRRLMALDNKSLPTQNHAILTNICIPHGHVWLIRFTFPTMFWNYKYFDSSNM